MSDLILTGRRGFLVRALGLATLPAAAAVPVVAMPTVSVDLIRRMQAWKVASDEYQAFYRDLSDKGLRLMAPGGDLTPEGHRYYDLQEAEHSARWAMLNEIAKT